MIVLVLPAYNEAAAIAGVVVLGRGIRLRGGYDSGWPSTPVGRTGMNAPRWA